jgi:hypothetical protein
MKIEKDLNYILISSQELYPAIFNSVRRTLISHVATLGFEEFIDPEDFALLFHYKVKKHHTVIDNTTPYPIPMLSHRLSRLPIFTTPEIIELLTGSLVFFTLSDPADFTKPLFNRGSNEMAIYSRCLTPVAGEKVKTETGWAFVHNVEKSRQIQALVQTLFPCNSHLFNLQPGQKIHAVVRPKVGEGIDNPRWSPCVQRYRFNRDPVWQETHPISDIIHKKTGEISLRRQFSTKPPAKRTPGTSDTYDLFMKPYEVELMVIRNGKMDQGAALLYAIDYLAAAVSNFGSMIITADPFLSKTPEGNIMRYTVPHNTYSDEAKDKKMRIYTGHTIANLLVTKMLQIVTRDIIPSDITLLSKILIAYKVPHPLIQQVIYTVQLPEDREEFTSFFNGSEGMADKLLLKAVTEVRGELDGMRLEISKER